MTKEIFVFASSIFDTPPTTDKAWLGVVVPIPKLRLIVVVLKAEEVANKFVEVMEVAEMLAGLKLVAERLVKNALEEVMEVPLAEENTKEPAKFEVPEI